MALDWLTPVPDRWPRKAFPPVDGLATFAGIDVPQSIAVPDILHTTWFLGEPCDRPVRRGFPILAVAEATGPAPDLTVTSPFAWATVPPAHPVKPALIAINPALGMTTPYEVLVAQQLGWASIDPGAHPTTRPPLGLLTDTLVVLTAPDFPSPCVEWSLESSAAPDLTTEAVTTADLVTEGVATADLLGEDVC